MMYNPQELFILVVASGVLLMALALYRKLIQVTSWKWLMVSFGLYYLSAVLTVAEGFWLPHVLNFMEHLFRSLFPLPIVFWIRAMAQEREITHRSPQL